MLDYIIINYNLYYSMFPGAYLMDLKKIVSSILCAAVFTGVIQGTVLAGEPEIITGTYTFTSSEGYNIQLTDDFVFRDDCFTLSSTAGCSHIAAISAQAALASASRYGDSTDPYGTDTSGNAVNLINYLTALGFSDVEANSWYSLQNEVNSCGVAVGARTITAGGHDYTLLAIIPRSIGYKQEWTGDLMMYTGYIHEGLLEARDECLRFTRQYIQNHNITGNIKVWIAGHSRGGAISNLLGGFFAGGGIEYFGGQVSITPEDIYCYTFAAPHPVRYGVATQAALSVSGARGGTYYADTPGDPYVYPEDTVIDLSADEFNGIHNYPCDWDFITYLPLTEWGYTYYGKTCFFDNVSEEQMLSELQLFSPFVYNNYISGSSASAFHEKSFDLAGLSLVDVGEGGRDAYIAFLRSRVNGVYSIAPSVSDFVDSGIQDTLGAVAGMYGMMLPMFREQEGLAGQLARPLALSYLAYAAGQLMAEGRAADEQEAIAIAFTEILVYFLNKDIDHTSYTVDQFAADLASFVRDNKESALVQKLVDLVSTVVPETYAPLIQGYLGMFYPGYDPSVPLGDLVVTYLCACADGADPDSEAYNDEYTDYRSGEAVRHNSLFVIAAVIPSLFGPEIQPVIDSIGHDADDMLDGSGAFSGFAYAVVKYIAGDGYTDIQTAADSKLTEALSSITSGMLTDMESIYPQSYVDAARSHTDTLIANIPTARAIVMTLLFYNGGSFNTESNIRNLCTFAGNFGIVPDSHYAETYVAYAKAAARMEPGHSSSSEQVIYYNMIDGSDVAWTGSGTISFTAQRSIEPETTYDRFTSVVVDETLVDPSMYTTASGSIIVTLSEAFLKSLQEGRHLIRIEFNDQGCAEAYFYTAILPALAPADPAAGEDGTADAVPDTDTASDTSVPIGDSTIASTGEEMNYTGIILLSAGALGILLSIRKRKKI